MNVTKRNIDDLNAVITVEVSKSDYEEKVEKILKNYHKTAAVPGFRKGHVPMGMIRKQFGKAVLLEEVNKLLQENLGKFIQEEKLDLLGNPLPSEKSDIDWDADTMSFDFEIGLAPTFDVDITKVKDVTRYKIVADDQMLDEQVMRIRKQYGKMSSKDTVAEGDDISGTFSNESEGISNPAHITLDVFKNKSVADSFIGKKVGDVISMNTKGLFPDDHQLMEYLKVDHDGVHGLDINVDFTIEEITSREPAEMNQEFFDKLFGPGVVSSEEEIKAKIKEDAEKQFAQQSNQKFMNDVSQALLKETKVDLPSEFLKKWLQTAGEKQMTAEEAAEEFTKSENALKYQLVEGKVMTQNNLQITFEDLKAYTTDMIKVQMAQFGQMNPSDSDVEGIVARVLSNQEEVKRLSDQVMSEKMMKLYMEKVPATEKEVNYRDFIAASYGE